MNKTIMLHDNEGGVYYPHTRIESVEGLSTQIARIDNILRVENNTEGNTELLDIRVDDLGVIHNSAGNAVRAQSKIKNIFGIDFSDDNNWMQGNVGIDGTFTEIATRISSNYIIVSNLVADTVIKIYCPVAYNFRAIFFDENKNVISSDSATSWHNNQYEAVIPSGAFYVRFSMNLASGENIELLERENLYIANCKSSLVSGVKNFYDDFMWISGSYYNSGVLTSMARAKCTPPIRLWEGAVVQFSTMYKTVDGIRGTRISLWNNAEWVKDLETTDVYNKPYIIIPKGCNTLSFTMFNEDENPTINIFPDLYTHNDSIVSALIKVNEDKLMGKRISILGDSVSTFGGSADDAESERKSDGTYTYADNRCRYPQSDLLVNVNEMWWKRLIDKHNMVLGVNESWAGSRVSWDGTTEGADVGEKKHIASLERISHLDENGTPDIIFIYAGANDVGNNVTIGSFNTENPKSYTEEQIAALPVATFADAYRTLLIRVQKSYPTSRVICILPYHTRTYYTSDKLDSYIEVIKTACDYFGIEYIDARADGVTMFNVSSYMPDTAHYNSAGMELLMKAIDRKIKNLFD